MSNRGIRNAWEEIHNQPYRAPDKVPDRVSDAPIPNSLWPKWCEEGDHPYFAISNGPTEYKCIICHLTEENDRLEAEKQDAHTEGWNAAIERADRACDHQLEQDSGENFDPSYNIGIESCKVAILNLSKPTAAKQGDPSSANRAEGRP